MGQKTLRRSLLIIIILLFISLACRGAAGFPNPFATATPTHTATPTITPSPSPTVTPSPTATPIPTVTPPPHGMTLEERADGSTTYRDYNSGIEMRIPSVWVALSANTQDFEYAMSQAAEASPAIAEAMQTLQDMDPDMFRLIAFDTESEHYIKKYLSNFSVVQFKDKVSTSLPMDVLTDLTAESIKYQYPNAKIISSGVEQTARGLDVGYVEITMPINLPSGTVLRAYQKQVYLIHGEYIVAITFSTPQELSETTIPFFDDVVDTIEFFEP